MEHLLLGPNYIYRPVSRLGGDRAVSFQGARRGAPPFLLVLIINMVALTFTLDLGHIKNWEEDGVTIYFAGAMHRNSRF